MSKFGKVCVSLLLALIAFLGVFLGVTTKGFKDWSKFSTSSSTSISDSTISDDTSSSEEVSETDLIMNHLYGGYQLRLKKEDEEYTRIIESRPKENSDMIGSPYFVKTSYLDEYLDYTALSLDYFDFYEIVRAWNGQVVTTYQVHDSSKSISIASQISSFSSSVEVEENLSSYEEMIKAGEDTVTIFKFYKKIVPTLQSDGLYKIDVIYVAYDIYL